MRRGGGYRRRPRGRHRHVARRFAAAAAVAGALGVATGQGAGAQSTAAVPERARALDARLMEDLRVLAHDSMGGRAPGTPGAEMTRVHLRRRLGRLGLEVREDTFAVRRPGGETPMGVNLRVRIPGSGDPDPTIVVMAHYDHLGTRDGVVYNGADDNASGTAALLEVARRLVAEPPEHTTILLFLDAEEGGLQGARHFVAEPSVPLARIRAAVNLDMVAHADSVLWVAGTHPWPRLRPVVERIAPADPVRLRFGHDRPTDRGGDNWVGASDHAAFHERDIPFLYFGVADHPDYHTPNDDADRVDPAFFAGAVETVWRVLRELDRFLDAVTGGEGLPGTG